VPTETDILRRLPPALDSDGTDAAAPFYLD